MTTQQQTLSYLMQLTPDECNKLIGYMACDLSHHRKFAALVRDFREWRESLSPAGAAVNARGSNAVQDVSGKNGTPAGDPTTATP